MIKLNLFAIFFSILLFLSAVLLPIFAQFEKEEVIDINLNYDNESVILTSVSKRQGFAPDYKNQPKDGYKLTGYDNNQNEIVSITFNFPITLISETHGQENIIGSIETLSQANTTISIPTSLNLQSINISSPSGEILVEHDLQIITDPKFTEDDKTVEEANKMYYPPYIFGFLVIIIVGALGYLVISKRNKSQPPTPPNSP